MDANFGIKQYAIFFAYHGFPIVDLSTVGLFHKFSILFICIGYPTLVMYTLIIGRPFEFGELNDHQKPLMTLLINLDIIYSHPTLYSINYFNFIINGRSLIRLINSSCYHEVNRKFFTKKTLLIVYIIHLAIFLFCYFSWLLYHSVNILDIQFLKAVFVYYNFHTLFAFNLYLFLYFQYANLTTFKLIRERFHIHNDLNRTIKIISVMAQLNVQFNHQMSIAMLSAIFCNSQNIITSVAIGYITKTFPLGIFISILLNFAVLLLLVHFNKKTRHQFCLLIEQMKCHLLDDRSTSIMFTTLHDDQNSANRIQCFEAFQLYYNYFFMEIFNLFIIDLTFILESAILPLNYVFLIIQTTTQ